VSAAATSPGFAGGLCGVMGREVTGRVRSLPCWSAVSIPPAVPPAVPPAGGAGPVPGGPVRRRELDVHGPGLRELVAVVEDAPGRRRRLPLRRDAGGRWRGELHAAEGARWWLLADGAGPLVDPSADDVEVTSEGPRAVVGRPWPTGAQLPRRVEHPAVYELHVRGFARTFRGVIDRLAYLADLGVEAIELMPVHPFDPRSNYWGYMPIVWGAVHRGFAEDPDAAAAELAALVAAAHDHGIEVWLDVVVNHTGEGDASLPTWTLRGLDDAHAYRRREDGSYTDDSGCGNDVDPGDPEIRRLVFEALERFAGLGVDGFRFDLASLLTRDGGDLVRRIGDWGAARGVRLVAEAWDLASYQVGDAFPDRRWAQWNDRFRDDVRGFLRAEPGLAEPVARRVAGSPDLFGAPPWRSVNFVTAHDGLTMHDLTAVTSDRHRSWDCGPELRLQQLQQAFCLLLLSSGTPMWVMGDEFARTQEGHDNPYDVDSPLTWVDWSRLDRWRELHGWVRELLSIRRRVAPAAGGSWPVPVWYGADGEAGGPPDPGDHDRRWLAWGWGDVAVVANVRWEPLRVVPPLRGADVCVALASVPPVAGEDGTFVVAPRSTVVLERGGRR